jgi:hypothetical protein
MAISSGIGPAANSGRLSQRPVIAVRNTRPSATASNDEAAYGRSLTYCARANPSVCFLPVSRSAGWGSDDHPKSGRNQPCER